MRSSFTLQSLQTANYRLCGLKNWLSQDLNSHDKLHYSWEGEYGGIQPTLNKNLPKTLTIIMRFCLVQRPDILVIVL